MLDDFAARQAIPMQRREISARPASGRGWQEHASLITAAWNKTLEGILETGSRLIEAKKNLDHGEFEMMIEHELPFKPSTARKLMDIARQKVLANRSHANVLPRAWTTLYELSKLTPQKLEEYIEAGLVNSDMERKEAGALLRTKSRATVDAEHDDEPQGDELGDLDQPGDVDDVEEGDFDQQGEEEGDDGVESDVERERRDRKKWSGDLISALLGIDRDVEEAARLCDDFDPSIAAAQEVTAERLRRCGRFLLALADRWDAKSKPISRREPRSRTSATPITKTRV
jgi:hypothetical protein